MYSARELRLALALIAHDATSLDGWRVPAAEHCSQRFFALHSPSLLPPPPHACLHHCSIEYPTEGGVTAFMNFYPPTNKDYEFPPGQLPALLVKIHGGPTSAASTLFNIGYQFWTSRGVWRVYMSVLLSVPGRAVARV